jgi:SSS family solute:Na+ symporter
MNLNYLDYGVIALYFVFVFYIAHYVSKKRQGSEESSDYFLAGRNLSWFVIGASLFASNIGSEHLIGLAGSGYAGGVAVAQFEILASFILLLLGWVFVPFYLRSNVYTMPEFLQARYSQSSRMYLSFISVVAYVLTKISVTIFAGAVVFEAMGVPFFWGAIIVVVATGLYTVLGGLRAVIYTDTMQAFVILAGSILVMILGINKLGGISELTATVPPEFFEIWKSMDHPDFPWTGILFGAPILGVWYWCTDQFIVQRVLSAKNIEHARRGTMFGGFLKITPLFLFVFPGIVCYALAQKGMITLGRADNAIPVLIDVVLPNGIKGLVFAGLLAALMSSLSSVFNSCSTLITYDFYKKFKPEASEKQLVLVGQVATTILVVLGIAWIPIMKYISGELYKYLQSVQAYISPPIAAVFLLGVFSRRLNATGAIASLLTGFVLGILRLILEINKPNLDGMLYQYADINFLHFALFLFVICSAVLVIVSLLTKAPDLDKISHITYDWSKKLTIGPEVKKDFILSVVLVVIIGIIWVAFS